MSKTRRRIVSFFIGSLVGLGIVCLIYNFIASYFLPFYTYPSLSYLFLRADKEPGIITITTPSESDATAHFGDTDISLLTLIIENSPIEDVLIKRISVPIYSTDFFEKLSEDSLLNIRIVDDTGKVLSSSELTFQSEFLQQNKIAYAVFSLNLNLIKSEQKKFVILADIPADSTAGIVATIPAYTNYNQPELHFETIGRESRKALDVDGEISQATYFRPNDGKGALLLSDITVEPTPFPANGTNTKLATISFEAQKEEDIEVSKIGVRITNYIPGQYRNVKLITDDGKQFGQTVVKPSIVDSSYPNAIFTGKLIVLKGETRKISVVSDTAIPQNGEYGIELQREITMLFPANSPFDRWVTATGVITKEKVYGFGYIEGFLEFE